MLLFAAVRPHLCLAARLGAGTGTIGSRRANGLRRVNGLCETGEVTGGAGAAGALHGLLAAVTPASRPGPTRSAPSAGGCCAAPTYGGA